MIKYAANDTENKGYILGSITLNKELRMKNRELTKLIAAANERIRTIANPIIMFNQIILLESRGSSEIENIITTNDELYKEVIDKSVVENNASKTLRIRSAVKHISKIIKKYDLVQLQHVKEIASWINGVDSNIRNIPGTNIQNPKTKEIKHIPPQRKEDIEKHMAILLKYFNEGGANDPITDSLLIHHAFEWIHPFFDGNGRIGRILIGAYLMLSKETSNIFLPISFYINKNRNTYYKILNAMTKDQDYEVYLGQMYSFLADAAQYTLDFTRKFDDAKNEVRELLFDKFKKYHTNKVLDSLFYSVYTRPSILSKYLGLNYRTIKNIVEFLATQKIFSIKKEGKKTYYINNKLFKGDD